MGQTNKSSQQHTPPSPSNPHTHATWASTKGSQPLTLTGKEVGGIDPVAGKLACAVGSARGGLAHSVCAVLLTTTVCRQVCTDVAGIKVSLGCFLWGCCAFINVCWRGQHSVDICKLKDSSSSSSSSSSSTSTSSTSSINCQVFDEVCNTNAHAAWVKWATLADLIH